MSTLPIRTQTPQPSGNAINAASNGNPADNQGGEPFANLLARQINGTVLATAHVQFVSIEDLAATTQINGQDAVAVSQDAAALAMPSGDPANALSAIMVQLPLETRPRAVADTSAAGSSTANRQAAASGIALPTGTSASDIQQAGATAQASLNASFLSTRGSDIADTANPSGQATAPQNNDAALTLLPGEFQPGKSASPVAADTQYAALSLSMGPSKQVDGQSNTAQHPHIQTSVIPAVLHGVSTLTHADSNTLAINTPLGNNGWADDFSQQISWLSTQKNQVAELHLNPPDLGPLDVVLTMSDKQASIQFSSPHGVVRDAVENALPKLREIFADNGIMLGNTTVSDQTPRDRNAAGFTNQNPGSGTRRNSDGEASQAGVQAVNDSPAVAVRRHIGMVDTFA